MKILCLGNGDNIGIRIYLWLKEAHQDVTLYRLTADEDPLRGNPLFYLNEKDLLNDKNIIAINDSLLAIRNKSLFGGSIIDKINATYDIVYITGGWHALLYSRKITVPKIFTHVGYEIHTKAKEYQGLPCARDLILNFRQTLRNHFYGWLTRNSLSKVTKITDWFPPTVAVNKCLGFEDKIIFMSFGEDVKRNKALANKPLIKQLNADTKHARRTFLWLSRVNFLDPSKANYKGSDLFIKALENFELQLASGELVVYMGKHGDEIEAFNAFVSRSPIFKYIRWVNHLDYPDLMSYLSIINGVLFTDFGEVNTGISGIGRDGYAMGIPMVNSTTNDIMIKQYTVPGPRTHAFTLEEIKKAMKNFLEMDQRDFSKKQKETADYGIKYVDQSFFIKRFLKEAKALTNQ